MKKIHNLIIVDESGSMSIIREQALAGMNETLGTIRSLAKKSPYVEQSVSLLTFDSNHKSYKYSNADGASTRDLRWGEYRPGGATPLYDAIGQSVSRLNSLTEAGDNVLVTIITDGEENCSQEWTLSMVNNLIGKLKKQGWTFTLIGTDNLDVEGMAQSMCIDDHLAFPETAEGTREMFAEERSARMCYNMAVAADMPLPIGSLFKKKRK